MPLKIVETNLRGHHKYSYRLMHALDVCLEYGQTCYLSQL